MKKLLFAGLCTAALATSCSNDLGVEGTHTVQLDATVSAEKTRAAFDSDGSFYWQTGDQIGVTTKSDNAASENETFTALTLQTGGGEATATFKGTIAGTLGSYAIYPYDNNQKINSTTLTYTFPSTYTYSKVDQTFFPTEKNGNSFRPAMLAKIADGSVAFKHLGGVFCINIASMPCTSGTLTLTTDQRLCGAYTATVTEDTPELKLNTAETASDNKSVSISFEGATKDLPGVFYIPVPTGTYTNATVTVTESGSTVKNVVAGTYAVDRSCLKVLSLKDVTVEAETVASTSDAESKLAEKDNVAVTNEVASNTTINIPTVTTTGAETAAKTLILQKVADDAAITVADKNNSSSSESSTSVKELTVSIPNTTSEKAPSVTVNMPKSTVTLAGNAGEATFKKVTATTAENTLVVSAGVTVKELEIAKGNVRINKGAKVEKLSLASGNTSAVVYYEDGATLPSSENIASGITAKCIIETEAQFAAAFANGGNYALLKDLTLNYKEYVTENKAIVIDLNGKTLTATATISADNGGDLTLKNGTINQNNIMYDDGLDVWSNSKLTLEGITYNGDKNGYNTIFIVQNAQSATVVVKNSTINGGVYAITTNASTNPVASNCVINLENSTFAAVESGALLNIPATVTMTNCEFSGNHQGAFLRGGTYTIENCKFTLNTIDPNGDVATKENNWMKTWGSGNRGAFAALTIGNYKATAYQYPTNITFKDATNKCTTAVTGNYASNYPAIHVCANATTDLGVTITGMSNITTPTSGCKDPAVEYGTNNITVDGSTPTINCNTGN